MRDLDPDTEAGSSHDEQYNDSSNTSAISFNDVDEVKGTALGTDSDMFPNFDPSKATRDAMDPKKDQGKKNDGSQDNAAGSA